MQPAPREPLLSLFEYLFEYRRDPALSAALEDPLGQLGDVLLKAGQLAAAYGEPVDYADCYLEHAEVRWCIRMPCTTSYVWSLVFATWDADKRELQGLS